MTTRDTAVSKGEVFAILLETLLLTWFASSVLTRAYGLSFWTDLLYWGWPILLVTIGTGIALGFCMSFGAIRISPLLRPLLYFLQIGIAFLGTRFLLRRIIQLPSHEIFPVTLAATQIVLSQFVEIVIRRART